MFSLLFLFFAIIQILNLTYFPFLFLKSTNKDLIYRNDILQLTCSKSCYNVIKSSSSGVAAASKKDSTGVKWHNDGVNTSSLEILLKWLTTEGNYNRYRGASDSLLPSDKGKAKD